MVKTLKRKKQLKIRNTKRSKRGGVDEKLLSAAELAARPPLNKISVSENYKGDTFTVEPFAAQREYGLTFDPACNEICNGARSPQLGARRLCAVHLRAAPPRLVVERARLRASGLVSVDA